MAGGGVAGGAEGEAALRCSQLKDLLGREGEVGKRRGVDNKGNASGRQWKGTPWDSVWDGA